MELVTDNTHSVNCQKAEFEAAAVISATLRREAARMPFDSPLRALALRSAIRWGRVGETAPVRLQVVD